MQDHNVFRDRDGQELARLFRAVEQGEMTLEDCLEQYPEHRAELAEIYGLAARIQSVSLPGPDPRFRSAARSRILTALATRKPLTLQERFWQVWQRTQFSMQARPALAIALILALLFSLTGAGSVYASHDAVPGDILYPLKLQVEDLRLAVASDEADEDLYRQFAETRVEEVRDLIAQGRYDQVPSAVERLENLMNSAAAAYENAPEKAHPETMGALSNNLSVLQGLLDQVPDAAKPGLENAVEKSSRSKEKLDRLTQEEAPAQDGEPQSGDVPGGKPKDPPQGKPDTSPVELPTQAQGQGGKQPGDPVDPSDDPSDQQPEAPGKGKPEKKPPADPKLPPGQQKTRTPRP